MIIYTFNMCGKFNQLEACQVEVCVHTRGGGAVGQVKIMQTCDQNLIGITTIIMHVMPDNLNTTSSGFARNL